MLGEEGEVNSLSPDQTKKVLLTTESDVNLAGEWEAQITLKQVGEASRNNNIDSIDNLFPTAIKSPKKSRGVSGRLEDKGLSPMNSLRGGGEG